MGGATASATARSRRRPTTTARSTAASSRTPVGVELLERVGADNVMFETDYPHQDGTWPHSRRGRGRAVRSPRPGHRPQDRPRQRASSCSASTCRSVSEEDPMTSAYDAVPGLLITRQDQVLRLTFDLAERRNALNDEVLGATIDAIDAAGRDEAVRVIVLAGAGDHFCSGSTSSPATPVVGPDPVSAASSAGCRRRPTGSSRSCCARQVPIVCVVRGLGRRHRPPAGAGRRLHRGRRRRPLLGAVRRAGLHPRQRRHLAAAPAGRRGPGPRAAPAGSRLDRAPRPPSGAWSTGAVPAEALDAAADELVATLAAGADRRPRA